MGVNEQTSGEDLMNYIDPLGTTPPTDDTTPALPTEPALPADNSDTPLQMPPNPVHRDETPPNGDSTSTLQTGTQSASRVDPAQLQLSPPDPCTVTRLGG